MRIILTVIVILVPIITIAQSRIDSLFDIGDVHFENKELDKAIEVFTSLKSELEVGSSDFNFASDRIVNIYYHGKDDLRNQGEYLKSINYLEKLISLIESEKEHIRPMWINEKKYFLTKTIIQNYFSLGQIDKAKKFQDILYKAYNEKLLPDGIDLSYSFEMFKWKDKNIWGYEWFEKLPEDRMSKSFTKINYYVYNTHPDGVDNELLYRIHFLMFHKTSGKEDDYVMTLYKMLDDQEQSQTLWCYTYNEPIDYVKAKKDVIEILKGNLSPCFTDKKK
ncbi:MAG: hypothetical protein COB15_16120 [Flavobacteriales bacterium]|nr:MAG: hypothetical protein COB15_16120 [Flavobacteriales bacterium]